MFKQESTSDLGSNCFDYVERDDDSRWLEYGVARHPSETSRYFGCPFAPRILLILVACFSGHFILSVKVDFSAASALLYLVASRRPGIDFRIVPRPGSVKSRLLKT